MPELAFPDSEILIAQGAASKPAWVRLLKETGATVHVMPEEENEGKDLSKVEVAYIGVKHVHFIKNLPNLKVVQCMGAGFNAVIEPADAELCRPYRILRVVEESRMERMACWNLWAVLNCQRRCEEYRQAQDACRWDKDIEALGKFKDNAEFHVGIMGLGSLGGPTAEMMLKMGYHTSTWTRTPKDREGMHCFAGAEQMDAFLNHLDVLICLLPLTPDTRGVLNAKVFAAMPKGSYVINCSRGKNCVTANLVAALDSDHLAGAILDVTDPEPLPADDPLWKNPKIRIFPHRATCTSESDIKSAVAQTMENRELVLSGKPVPPERELDWSAGY